MKKIICLILAAAFLLLAGCQANDQSKTYSTEKVIQKIEKNKKSIESDEDRSDLVYAVKTVSKSKTNLTALSSRLNCFVEESSEIKLALTEKVTVYPAVDDVSNESYTEVTVSYNSEINYIYHCKDKNWTIEITE